MQLAKAVAVPTGRLRAALRRTLPPVPVAVTGLVVAASLLFVASRAAMQPGHPAMDGAPHHARLALAAAAVAGAGVVAALAAMRGRKGSGHDGAPRPGQHPRCCCSGCCGSDALCVERPAQEATARLVQLLVVLFAAGLAFIMALPLAV